MEEEMEASSQADQAKASQSLQVKERKKVTVAKVYSKVRDHRNRSQSVG